MSLYTPVFPPFHEFNNSQKGSHENNSVGPPVKQQNYVKYLRDVHLFLSTQNDVLSPPSRPNSPLSDHRVQKVKDKIHDILNAREHETSSGKWARASQTLKLGCVRGRYWSLPQADPCASEQNAKWILPDEESEWIEWEKKREEDRRLQAKTNVSQLIGGAVPAQPDSQIPDCASFAGPSQPCNSARHRPPGISSSALRAAKEKVRKWQASMASEVWHDTTCGSSPASTREVVATTERNCETAKPQRSHTLEFSVVKPAAKSFVGKGRKGSVVHPAIWGDFAPAPLRKSKFPKAPQTSKGPHATTPVNVDSTASKGPASTPHVKDHARKIRDVRETPYLPPSFPANLETSTPLADSKMLIRAKPLPILPALLPTPSAPANPPDDRQLVSEGHHAPNVTSSLPPHVNTAERGKRSLAPSTPVVGILNDPPVTPPAKRPRTLSPPVPQHSTQVSTNRALNAVLCTSDEARDGAAPSHPVDSLEMTSGVRLPLTPDKNKPGTGADIQDLADKIPSPTKSVKSYFSAPDSDPADEAMEANLLLESPVSPMLSYAQNASVFLPQITSTQVRKGSPTPSRTDRGLFGMGYSSQFDVERHVDRVSELLEKDVDFDGWMRDARTVEMNHD